MYDFISAPIPKQVPQHTQAEVKGFTYFPVTLAVVEIVVSNNCLDINVLDYRSIAVPLFTRKVGNVVSGRCEVDSEFPIPPFCTTNRVRIETIVDDADPRFGFGSRSGA
jgi:hypothetical protein